MKLAVIVALGVVALAYYAPPVHADTDIMDEIRSLDVFKLK